MNAPRPVEIVGGGLAGLALGLALRRADVPVTLLEAGAYPRHRVCGEFISGLAPATIERLGLAPFLADALLHRAVTWFRGARVLRTQTLPTPAFALSRHVLDARLAEAFVAAGGELRTGVRGELAPRAGRVLACGRRAEPASEWLGLKVHARGLPLVTELELHLGDGAYVGACLIEGGLVNVCGLFRRRRPGAMGGEGTGRSAALPAALRASGLDALAARLDRAEIDPDACCAVAGLAFGRQRAGDDAFAIGDRHAMIAPFTGNGMAMALQGAALALDPLLAWSRGEVDWAGATATLHGRQGRDFAVRLAGSALLHPFLLGPRRQRCLVAAAPLLPLRPLYHLTH